MTARPSDANVPLNVDRVGDGPPLLLLHGFTGSAATWSPFLKPLAERYGVIATDLPGHGRSGAPSDPAQYALAEVANRLAAMLTSLDVGRAALLGYSMGGRTALRFALAYPELVAALILESTNAGITDPAARAARIRSDAALADMIEREGIEAFVDHWESLPLWTSQERLPATVRDSLRRARLANDATGLANSLRGASAGLDEPVLDRLHELSCPVLYVAGALDERYAAAAREMAAATPCATLEIVPEAGHAVHLERPDAFLAAVRSFLETVPRSGREWR